MIRGRRGRGSPTGDSGQFKPQAWRRWLARFAISDISGKGELEPAHQKANPRSKRDHRLPKLSESIEKLDARARVQDDHISKGERAVQA